MDPIGLRARELRSRRQVARRSTAGRRSTRPAGSSTARWSNGPAALRRALLTQRMCSSRRAGREAADLRARPGAAPQDMPAVRAIVRERGRRRLPVLVADSRRREERRSSRCGRSRRRSSRDDVHHTRTSVTSHISARHRREMALPLLDSMAPAQTPLRATAASPKNRFACFYVPHGATMDKWTPAAEGGGFAFTEILKPLEPFRDQHQRCQRPGASLRGRRRRRRCLGGREPHPCRGGVPDGRVPEKGARAHLGVSADQVAAQHIGQDTPLPSLELSIEEAVLGCEAAFSCAYRNSISGSRRRCRCRCRTIRGWCSRRCSATAAPGPARGRRQNREACSIQ